MQISALFEHRAQAGISHPIRWEYSPNQPRGPVPDNPFELPNKAIEGPPGGSVLRDHAVFLIPTDQLTPEDFRQLQAWVREQSKDGIKDKDQNGGLVSNEERAGNLVPPNVPNVSYDAAGLPHRVALHLPQAESVKIRIHHKTQGGTRLEEIPLRPDSRWGVMGLWQVDLSAVINDRKVLEGLRYDVVWKDTTGKEYNNADPAAHRLGTDEPDGVGPYYSRFATMGYRWSDKALAFESERGSSKHRSRKIIYEMLPAAWARSGYVPGKYRGTWGGLRGNRVAWNHLKRLGGEAIAIEMLPQGFRERHRQPDGKRPGGGGDWGYWNIAYPALDEEQGMRGNRAPNIEFMRLVDAFHQQRQEVYLDVVFNHGGNLLVQMHGQTVLRLHYGNYFEPAGFGWALNSNDPRAQEYIIRALEHLVKYYHIDGFRFDLATALSKETYSRIARRLKKHCSLILEPWSPNGSLFNPNNGHEDDNELRLIGGYQSWSDRFQQASMTLVGGRRNGHWRNEQENGDWDDQPASSHEDMVRAFVGGFSVDPQANINFLTAHDGWTLSDRLELAGHKDERQRKRRAGTGMLMLLTSQGRPMIAEGTEFMYSKLERGATQEDARNSWNHPHLNPIDLHPATRKHADLVDFTGGLIRLREVLHHFDYDRPLQEGWNQDFEQLSGSAGRTIGLKLKAPQQDQPPIVILANGEDHWKPVTLPEGNWKVIADSDRLGGNPALRAFDAHGQEGRVASGTYHVAPGAGVLLVPADWNIPDAATINPSNRSNRPRKRPGRFNGSLKRPGGKTGKRPGGKAGSTHNTMASLAKNL